MLRLITARKGITLSSGLHLPHGTYVAVAHPQMTASVSYQEASDLPQPPFDEFHPFRYSVLRSYEGEENKHQFVTTSPESVSFGHGQWACPGRFFASNEIKVILIELLRNYDIGLGPNGEGQSGEFQRPKTYTVNTSYIPDPTAKIFFRRRQ
jgi:gliotoxin biosynthesis cytochrome P450 monooxygenase